MARTERTAGERIAAPDAVAEHAAREAAREAETVRWRELEHLVRTLEALDPAPRAARDGQRAFDFEHAAGPEPGGEGRDSE